ncbi:LysR family transcriptional regulator [Salinarimonas sp. NSM]|uniref:LysR family transcriptional regulator n=1 Tax=Salinarimonas sp. NSM TaxID=3458003 RepID=UPI004036CA8C
MLSDPAEPIKKNLDLRLLHQYVVICRQPTLAAAAVALGVSKPAVSQIVARLESELAVALFERSRTGMRLLPAGRRLLDLAQTILADERATLSEMRSFRDHVIPRLRVYVMESLSPLIVTALYNALADQVGVISLESGRGETCVPEFLRGEIDLLVSTELFEDMPGTIDVHPLCSQELCLIAPQSAGPTSLPELAASLPLVRAPNNTRMHSAIAHYLGGLGVTPIRELSCRSLTATLEIVSAGRGWALLPPLGAAGLRDRLDAVSISAAPGRPPVQKVALAVDRDRFLEIPSAAAAACRGALREHMHRLRAGHTHAALASVQVY